MTETRFAAALLDPDAPVPAGLVDPEGRPAPLRFSVYRNNVTSGLVRAMETGFPVVRRLVGDAFFSAMAVEFARRFPPRSAILMLYGDDFPAFLQDFAPVAHLGYLPDVARLELAIRQSYHAADAAPADLSALTPDRLIAARLTLAPALRLIRSRWPVYGIWRANIADEPLSSTGPEDVIVLRPAFDPEPRRLPPGAAAFVAALCDGHCVAEAIDAGGPELDLNGTLATLLGGGGIVGVHE